MLKNKEGQPATTLALGLALALFGWILVYPASPLPHPNEEERAMQTRYTSTMSVSGNAAYLQILTY